MTQTTLRQTRRTLLLLLWAVSIAFVAILSPFLGPILWALILALLFAPVFQRLLRTLGQRRNLAAALTLLLIVLVVVVPLLLLVTVLGREAGLVYVRLQSGEWDSGAYLNRLFDALPDGVRLALEQLGMASFETLKVRVNAAIAAGMQTLAVGAFGVGQDMFRFVAHLFIALYLAFFLLRDGGQLARLLRAAIPLATVYQRSLATTFATALRATVKGHLVVAVVQGFLGGLAFTILGLQNVLLWAALMAVLSLVPVVGSSLVWLPMALYLLATGALAQGLALIAFGVMVIGLVDNLLRPLLVGKDTRMPDAVVMIATLAGIVAFGVDGLVLGPAIAALFIAVWQIDMDSRPAQDDVGRRTDADDEPWESAGRPPSARASKDTMKSPTVQATEALELAQAKSEFTSEGSPPPGHVSTAVPVIVVPPGTTPLREARPEVPNKG